MHQEVVERTAVSQGPHPARRSTRWGALVVLLIALSTLGSIGWAARIAWSHPYDGLDWIPTGRITSIDPDGPTARTGLQVGDQVVAIDGRPWRLRTGLYPGGDSGDRITLLVLRQGAPLTVSFALTAPPLRVRLLLLEPLLVSLVFWGVGLITWRRHSLEQVPQIFLLMSQIMATMLAMGLLSALYVPWARLAFAILLPLLTAVMFHFYALFPMPLAMRPQRWLVGAAYGVAAVVILVTLITFLRVRDVPPELRTGQRVVVALMLLGALALLCRRPSTASITHHRRLHVMLAGMTVSLLPLLGLSFLPELLWGVPLVSYFGTFPFLALLPISYAYVVSHADLGRIDRVLNRSVVYALLTAGWLGLYILAYGALGQLLPASSSWSHPIIGGGLAILVAALFIPLRTRLQCWVDQLFYGGWYDYRSIVQATSAELSQTRDLDHLVDRLLTAVQAMRFRSVVCFWADGHRLMGKGCRGEGLTACTALCLPADGALAHALRVAPRIHWRADLQRALPGSALVPAERALLAVAQAQVWLPLVRNGSLHGVLVLGDRSGGTFLAQEDGAILVTLAHQGAVAAENIWLLEGLRVRLRQVEQMRDELLEVKRRLIESREAERLRLAQDLHDGPLQDIYSVRFHLGALQGESGCQAACAALRRVDATLQHVTDALRLICGELRPSSLMPFGLEKAIRSHLDRVRATYPALQIDCDLMSDDQVLSVATRLALFRVYQEALHNIVRHAHARWALVRLCLDDQEVILEVHDDGCGFTVPARWLDLARLGHLGLLGAAERIEAVGGHFAVISAPGEGTVVRVVLPRSCLCHE